jgi:hypothetical protein
MDETDIRRTGIHPAAVEILPVEEVAAITARYDELIRRLEDELETALAEATAAEARLLRHPAANVIDDDFEAFVLWATESQVIDINRNERGDHRNDQRRDDYEALRVNPPPVVRVQPRPAPEPPTPQPPTVQPPTVVETPPVRIDAPPADGSAVERAPRPTRLTGRTTVVTRPGAPAPKPTAPEAPEAAARTEAVAVVPAAPKSDLPPPAPRAEHFWEGGRASRASRASRDERGSRGRVAALPSTLLLQTGAMIVVVALILLKLG